MIRTIMFTLALGLFVSTSSRAETQTCGEKLEGIGVPLKFASPLLEPDRIGLLASIYLAMNDASGRGTWPISEIDIALPCEIASFTEGDDTWIISAGGGYAPLRWARAKGRDEIFFLTNGPSLNDAWLWRQDRAEEIKGFNKPLHYLVGIADEKYFIFNVYEGAPSGKMLADDIHNVLSRKLPVIAIYDPKGSAASLFLTTQSRRTSKVFRPERLIGGRAATLYGPDGFFFTPTPGDAALLRGSDLTCHLRYGSFERVRLGVIEPEDSNLDLSCHYESGESFITIFSTYLPDAGEDRKTFERMIKEIQDEDGVIARLPGPVTGPRQILQGGRSWIDKARLGQGLWYVRRGDFVYEIRATFPEEDSKALFRAVETFALSTQPDANAR